MRRTPLLSLLLCWSCGGDDSPALDETTTAASTEPGSTASSTTATPTDTTATATVDSTGTSDDGSTTAQTPTGPELVIFNVVRDEAEEAFFPLPEPLYRVELPPRATFEARVPEGTTRVEFQIDGGALVIDEAAPFRLDENDDGTARPWTLAFGAHDYQITAYAGAAELGATAGSFTLSDVGMEPGHVPQTPDEQQAWLDGNLDGVMEARSFVAADGHVLPYRLYTPAFYDPQARYPVLVYLHGRGQRGSDNPPDLYSSQLFHGPSSIVAPNAQADFPSFVVVPQCSDQPTHHEWAHWVGNSEDMPFAGLGADGSYVQHADPWPSAQAVRELVDALQGELSLEADRIYLTGESMGGFGTWEFTTRWPDVFVSGVPMAGFSDRTKVGLILDIPFWVFHGDADTSNPVEGSRAMVEAINAAGGSARYTEYPGTGHGETFNRAWTEEPELQPWIYSQRRHP
jgi:pimeloyl-ACP methyl ester carboxylesterase